MQIKFIALLALPFFALLITAALADPGNGESNGARPILTQEQKDTIAKISTGVKNAAACFQASNYKDINCHKKVTEGAANNSPQK
ncbi:hypothetical protein BDA99DRAFT_556017 [Phascolomyces articulosus]|uniref:Uncharacterized protein n=1 Tax=Phascolomyces articulosus TaxID=60185 RepID=A0AAD5KL87_9FUNG|nr:hypothetical protein BDA99DRAFT_556017 [Phascolomyces articulosus]